MEKEISELDIKIAAIIKLLSPNLTPLQLAELKGRIFGMSDANRLNELEKKGA